MISDRGLAIGLGLIVLGVVLLLIVFAAGYKMYNEYQLATEITEQNAAVILGISAQVLINLLVKIAFLGIALAAGAIILGRGVDLVKKCPTEK
ncbi:MAG: hypothetical protein GSR77_05385 [Desulfurococcales archaeon]|nr:hypothetical protein [Desulfurococcales archaeon]